MENPIVVALKQKIDVLKARGISDAETLRNAAKEELQYYVLDFVFHHPKCSVWTMYGGSALRICHGLDRMSVDLDFEIDRVCTDAFLKELKAELEGYFYRRYGIEDEELSVKITNGRGVVLQFLFGDFLGIAHPSKQIHVKIDLNHFVEPKASFERVPVSRSQLAFVIKTYTMSTLMASKIAAILLRGKRGIGKAFYEEKGRDIYDLLWYMEKRVVPDLDYLAAKGVDMKNIRTLFDRLTLQMNKVNDKNLRQDLLPLFVDGTYVKHWIAQWRAVYLSLVGKYNIRTITGLREIFLHGKGSRDKYTFSFYYDTEEGEMVEIVYNISDYWFRFKDGEVAIDIDEKVAALLTVQNVADRDDRIKKYATLFYKKNTAYLKKSGGVLLGNGMRTKLIRLTADHLNHNEEIFLDRSTLLSCELEDLLA